MNPSDPRPRSGSALAMGVVIGAGLGAGALWGLGLALRGPDTFDLVVRGAEVSRHKGAQVVVAGARETVIQTCNGVCDDLRLEARTGDNSFKVHVKGADGRFIASGGPGYVTTGMTTHAVVGGRDELKIAVHRDP